jgi:hypothetical protein
MDEVYEGNFEERRSIVYTLNFTMKAWFFGPEKETGIIKFIDIRYATDSDTNTTPEEFYTLQPGMTAANTATTNPDLSVDYSLIEFDDNWDYADKIANTAPTD